MRKTALIRVAPLYFIVHHVASILWNLVFPLNLDNLINFFFYYFCDE